MTCPRFLSRLLLVTRHSMTRGSNGISSSAAYWLMSAAPNRCDGSKVCKTFETLSVSAPFAAAAAPARACPLGALIFHLVWLPLWFLFLLSARGLRSCQSRSSFRPKSHQARPGRVVDFSRTAKCEGCKFRFENRSQTLHQHFCAWPLWTVGLIGRRTSASPEGKTEACFGGNLIPAFGQLSTHCRSS
jgi:hypothetical protein